MACSADGKTAQKRAEGVAATRKATAPATWTLVGPFAGPGSGADPTGMGKDYLAAYGGEAALAAPGTALPAGLPSARATERGGQVGFLAAFPGRIWASAYAIRDFESPGGEAVLRIGSDDGIKLWLNGRMLLDDRVMRALDPDSSLIRVALAPGTNRILAKVDQGTGDWALSVRISSSADEEARAAARRSIGLSAAQSGPSTGDEVSFVVSSDPPFALKLPVEYRVASADGKTAASGRCALGSVARSALPGRAGVYRLTARLATDAASPLAGKFEGAEASVILVKGDESEAFAWAADRAEAAALRAASSGAGPLDDTAATLEFLAARMRGSLDPSLESESLRLKAIAFSEDIVEALRGGPSGPASLRGYRQMAYRSAIDGNLQPYSLYVPRGYDASRKYGLVVALHGYTGHDYDGGLHLAKECPEDFVVLSAYGRGDMHYRSIGEQDVLDVMDRIMARYAIDPDRVYLTGNSMGGLGTWMIGEMYPDRFAAIAPFCGWTGRQWIGNLRSLPVLVVHGDADSAVPISFEAKAVADMKKSGFDVRFDVLAGVGHSAWTGWRQAKPDESIFDFFRARVRKASPERITASIPYARYGKQYWIRIDELDTGGDLDKAKGVGPTRATAPRLPAPGSVDAARVSPARIKIATKRVRAMTVDLSLAGASVADGTILVVDGTRIRTSAGARRVSIARAGKDGWRIVAEPPAGGLARHDGGGIADLFTRPLVIAYGTKDPARRPALESAARALADWSWTQSIQIGVKTGRFVVKADLAVTEDDLATRELLIVGNARENALAAKAAREIGKYYRDGMVCLGGKDFPGSGLGLLLPSPIAPGRLMGYLDLPVSLAPDSSEAATWCAEFLFRLRNADVSEASTYPGFCPDVMALTDSPYSDAWSGWFDRNWENLEGR